MRFNRFIWMSMVVVVIGVGCMPNPTIPPTPTKTPAPLVENTSAQAAAPVATALPPTEVPTTEPTPLPPEPTAEPTSPPSNADGPTATFLPPPPVDASLPAENYCMVRPIPTGWQDYLDRTYPYGSTSGGQYLPHNGGDFPNPVSTPVVAVGNGTIIYAGSDAEVTYGPQLDFYGNLIVMQVESCSYGGRPVYALYGHLAEVNVEAGQQVSQGETIGGVGGTGVAAGGAHLHFEVRVGDPNDYFTSTRNPDLWIRPYGGYGTLAGRVVNSDGSYLPDVTIQIVRNGTDDLPRYAYTYTSAENRPDDAWGENFTYGDLPEGWYTVSTGAGRYREEIYIRPGETSWVEFRFGQ